MNTHRLNLDVRGMGVGSNTSFEDAIARQRLQQRMVFQFPLVQFRQADDQAPPIGWVLFDGFQWLLLFVCLK
jgi:hypothetical protein